MARLLDKYKKEIIPEMVKRFGFKNSLRVPHIVKIVINMGIGEGTRDSKLVEDAAKELALISGQMPVITKAKKSIAGFKVRAGQPVGCKVTLRGLRMYEFLDRFISVAVPRIRDFRGFPSRGFDKKGNYSFGLDEQTIFPELNLDKVKRTQGMDITLVFDLGTVKETRELLKLLGFPFVKKQGS